MGFFIIFFEVFYSDKVKESVKKPEARRNIRGTR